MLMRCSKSGLIPQEASGEYKGSTLPLKLAWEFLFLCVCLFAYRNKSLNYFSLLHKIPCAFHTYMYTNIFESKLSNPNEYYHSEFHLHFLSRNL